ncbi:hypothetical protein ABW20_dc0102524 [Dactylellina cionopaga]|nr:hypothetical protein ABW20_dc0102524 [Dactylellina cionopaga]
MAQALCIQTPAAYAQTLWDRGFEYVNPNTEAKPPSLRPPTASWFAALPSDIIFEICDYLPNSDVLKLQLVSSTIRQKLPRRRIDAIHSHKTYFLCQDGIRKLERIARIPALAKKVTHITFDLESPYVGLLKRYWCIGTAMGYPQETRFKMQRWYHNHMRRGLIPGRAGKMKDKRMRASMIRKILKKLFPSINETQSAPQDIKPTDPNDPESTNYEDTFHEIFTLFEVHLTSLYLQWQSKADLLERITSAFRSLPNLKILEFIRTDVTKEDPSVMLSIWREYNPDLAWLLNSNPEITDGDLPWTDWFSREALHSHLWEAYPSILFCAAQAKRRIKEVRVGTLSLEYPKAGAMISFFEPYHARISDTTGRQATEEELNAWIERHAEGYKYTFNSLRRLELCLDEKERETYHRSYSDVSPLFLETVKNVEELVVWRIPSEVRKEVTAATAGGAPVAAFLLPTDMELKNLRRLEIGRAGVAVKGLLAFMRANRKSLKELVCGEETFGNNVTSKEDIISFLSAVREDVKLESLEIDFLAANYYRRLVDERKYYLSIRVTGDWKDVSFCQFEVGMKYQYTTATGGEAVLQSHWRQKNSWEEFIRCIMDTDVEDYFRVS